jgi:hypothetical protein
LGGSGEDLFLVNRELKERQKGHQLPQMTIPPVKDSLAELVVFGLGKVVDIIGEVLTGLRGDLLEEDLVVATDVFKHLKKVLIQGCDFFVRLNLYEIIFNCVHK